MRKTLVLIVLLFLANSITLLAQTNKSDSTASKKDPAKPAISQTQPDTSKATKAKSADKQPDKKALDKALKQAAQKKHDDSLATVKALKIAVQKKQGDSVALAKTLKIAAQKKHDDSLATAKTLKLSAEKNKKDSLASAKTASKTVVQKPKADSIKSAKAATVPVVQKPKADSVKSAAATVPVVQKPKADSLKSAKTAVPVVQKPKADSVKSAKTATAPIVQKSKADSAASIKPVVTSPAGAPVPANLASQVKADTGKKATPAIVKQTKADSTQSNKKLSKKELAKLAKSQADTVSTKSKVKPVKGKSAKELKREAQKNDVNNLTEKDLAKMVFKNMASDSNSRMPARRVDIPFTNARPLPLAEPNILNIKFYHRYWRDIDVLDPKNKKFAQYHADLITALLEAIKKKEITAYSPVANPPENPTGDAFTLPIAYSDFMAGLSDTTYVDSIDKEGNKVGSKPVPNPFTPAKISGYRIKEDVFYDKTRSKSITRIIGIAPLIKLTLSSGELIGIQPLFWVRFKDCRKVLVTIDVDPTKKIGDSMDDVFLQRRFYGRIVQESNLEGKRIKDYKTEPADQEAEAQRMEKKIVTFKRGSWNYTMLTKAPPPGPNDNKQAPKIKKSKVTPK